MMRVSKMLPMFCLVAALLAGCEKSRDAANRPATAASGPAATSGPAADAPPSVEVMLPAIASAPADPNLRPIELNLPRPMFLGTPKNIPPGTTVEKPSNRLRAPFYAPKDVANVALGKPVTASDEPIMGRLEQAVDGIADAQEGNAAVFGPGKTWVQIDLGSPHEIFAVVLWHMHSDPRVYRDVVVKASADKDFITATTLFNNDQDNSIGEGAGKDREFFETHEGKLIEAKGAVGRYVRLFSNGSTSEDLNFILEAMIFARPAK